MRAGIKNSLEKRTTELAFLAVILITVLGAGIAADAFTSTNSGGDLVAEYRFDTGAGETAYDTAGNNDGTINGGAKWTKGVDGKALKFDGQDDYVSIQSLSYETSNLDEVTVSAWVKSSSGPSSSAIVGFDESEYYSLQLVDRHSNKPSWRTNPGGHLNANQYYNDSRWHHFVGVFDGDGSPERSFIIDGEVVASDSISGETLGSGNKRYGFLADDSEATSFDGSRNGATFDGEMDDVRIYHGALNLSQVRSLYNSGSWRIGTVTEENKPSKVLDISFQHQNSSHVYDTSGNENHGTPQNGALQETALSCKVGRCYSFDGSDDYVNLGKESSLKGINGITIMGYFYNPSGGRWISKDRSDYWNLGDRGWEISDGSITDINNGDWTNSIPSDTWTHVSATYNPDTGYQAVYLDGQLEASQNLSSPITIGVGSNRDAIIGCNVEEDGSGSYSDGCHRVEYSGKLDQVKVFNRSLSQQEIIENTRGLEGGGTVLDLRFNRNGGDKVHDYSGEGNTGTLQPNSSAGPEWTEGLTGNALEFDGNNDQVDWSSVSGADGGGYSISYWFNVRKSDNGALEFVRSNAFSTYAYTKSAPLNANFGVFNKSRDDFFVTGQSRDLEFNKWYHFAATADAKNNQAVLWINGEKQSETSTVGALEKISSLEINNRKEHEGKIDNLKIYPYAVSKSKIRQLYQQGKSHVGTSSGSTSSTNLQEGLVLSQSFDRVETCGQSDTISCPDGMSGEVAVDESGSANHGELVNGPTEKSSGNCQKGGCLSFDGGDDFVGGKPDDLNFTRHDSFSASFWMKPAKDTNGGLIYKGEGSSPYTNWGVIQRGSGGPGPYNIKVLLVDDWSSSAVKVDGLTNLNDQSWHHVAFTYNGSSSASGVDVFVDGKEESYSIDQDNLVGSITNNRELRLGTRYNYQYWNGKMDQVRVYNRSLSKDEVWKLYTEGRDTQQDMAGPVAHYPMNTEASPLRDVSGEENHGDLNLLGETGTFNTSDGEWKTIRFERSYKDPVVVGTSNTHNGESALSFEARNVQSHKAEMRVCESEGGSGAGCDTHGTEKVGYMVINANATKDIPGIEAGSFSIDRDFDGTTKTISYAESFSNDPYVLANVNTDNGKRPVEARVRSYSNTSFTAGICHQETTDACDSGHVAEEVGWAAIEPGNIPFKQKTDLGSTGDSVSNSAWTQQSFSTSFNEKPIAIVSTVSNDGGEDNLIDEARNINTTYLEVRYCEVENGDNCDSHTSEEVAWFAAEKGLLTYTNGNFPRYVDTERGTALKLEGSDDSVSVNSNLDIGADGSISAWFKKPSTSGTRMILDKYSGGYGYSIFFQEDDLYANYGNCNFDAIATPKPDEWHYVALTNDDSDNACKVFLDGKEIASTSSGGDSDVSNKVDIGSRDDSKFYFDGKIDDVRIYPYALSQEEVKNVMNQGAFSAG